MVAGDRITIQGNTISASGGATHTIQVFDESAHFNAIKHVVTIAQQKLTTFSFACYAVTAENVFQQETFTFYEYKGGGSV